MASTPEAVLTGTVHIAEHSIELPEPEARNLFLAAGIALKTGRPLAINPDTMVHISRGTHLSITIADGFTDDYNPEAFLNRGRS